MYVIVSLKKKVSIITSILLIFIIISLLSSFIFLEFIAGNVNSMYAFNDAGHSFIKWVEFDVPLPLMKDAMKLDVDSHNNNGSGRLNWIELISIMGAKYYGKYSNYKKSDLERIADELRNGKTLEEITGNLKNYSYYLEVNTAVLGGFVGEYETQVMENNDVVWKKQYGFKAFSPIAKGFVYTDYDDFGVGRSYGYKRKHLGHDLMALTGTPSFIRYQKL